MLRCLTLALQELYTNSASFLVSNLRDSNSTLALTVCADIAPIYILLRMRKCATTHFDIVLVVESLGIVLHKIFFGIALA